jgi:hypothetical protein
MTDEEMAKEYANPWETSLAYVSVKEAFLAGLKAGKDMNVPIKWHKVADGDLPDNTDSVLSDKGVIVYYNFTHACWVDERASVEIDEVIAWCELPKWEIKEK